MRINRYFRDVFHIFDRFDAVAFVANILAVILGILITFSIQGIIDRKEEKKNVNSALKLLLTSSLFPAHRICLR